MRRATNTLKDWRSPREGSGVKDVEGLATGWAHSVHGEETATVGQSTATPYRWRVFDREGSSRVRMAL